jgi:hypothetical protein
LYHYDFYAQALSKLERGHERDTHDVEAMLAAGRIHIPKLKELFQAISADLIRYPALDPHSFSSAVSRFCSQHPPA